MTDVKPSQYILAIIIFCMLFMGGTIWLSQLNAVHEFGDGELEAFNNTFNSIDGVTVAVDKLNEVVTTPEEPGVFGFLNTLIGGAWSTLKLLGTTLSFANMSIDALTGYFGVPAYIPLMIGAMLSVIIVLSIIGAIMQKDL